MLVPSWVSDLVDRAFSIVPIGREIRPLPPLAAYLSAWLYITVGLALIGLVLYPVGAIIWTLGYNVTNQAPSGLALAKRISTAKAGLQVQNIGLTLQKASGIRMEYPDRPIFDGLSRGLSKMRKTRLRTRVIRALLWVASIFIGICDGILHFALAAIRPSWLNIVRWTAVIVFLNPQLVATTSWSDLLKRASSLNIPLPTVVAILGLLSLAVGTVWRGGHKWSSKFFETAESKRLEFLNQALPMLGDIARGLEKRAKTCDKMALHQLGDVVQDMTDGRFKLDTDGTVVAVPKADSSFFFRRSVRHPLQDSSDSLDLEGVVERLSEAYEKIASENWNRFLWSRCPARVARMFYNFNFEVQQWGALGLRLTMTNIEERARRNADIQVAQSAIQEESDKHKELLPRGSQIAPGRTQKSGRGMNNATLINWLEDGVEGEVERIDDLLTGAAEAIALIQLIYSYAQKQTRVSLPKRFLGTR